MLLLLYVTKLRRIFLYLKYDSFTVEFP